MGSSIEKEENKYIDLYVLTWKDFENRGFQTLVCIRITCRTYSNRYCWALHPDCDSGGLMGGRAGRICISTQVSRDNSDAAGLGIYPLRTTLSKLSVQWRKSDCGFYVQYSPGGHKSLHIWKDINSWEKSQNVYYIQLLTVFSSEEGQHFCFDSILLYYFTFFTQRIYLCIT